MLYEVITTLPFGNSPVYKVHHQHTENDGKLVETDQASAYLGGRHLSNVYRANGRGQTYTNSANQTIEIKGQQQAHGGLTFGEEKELGHPRSQSGKKKEDTREDQGTLSSDTSYNFV